MLDKKDTMLKVPVVDKAKGNALPAAPSPFLPSPLPVVEMG